MHTMAPDLPGAIVAFRRHHSLRAKRKRHCGVEIACVYQSHDPLLAAGRDEFAILHQSPHGETKQT